MSYSFYKIMHFAGLFLLFLSLGAYMAQGFLEAKRPFPGQKLAAISHGVGMLLIFVAGFGLMARLEIGMPWPGWIYGKIAIWLVLGGSIALIKRKTAWERWIWWGVLALGILSAYFARVKPF